MIDAPSASGRRAPATRVVASVAAADRRVLSSPKRRRRPPARRRQRLIGLSRLVLLIVVVVIAIWAGTRVANATSDPNSVRERTYVVRQGDTVWTIAGRAYPGGHDPRELVFDIERRNGMSNASLRPGQHLVLPLLSD